MTNASSADETVDLMPDLNAAAMTNGFLRVLARSCMLCLCEGSLAPLAANVCSQDCRFQWWPRLRAEGVQCRCRIIE